MGGVGRSVYVAQVVGCGDKETVLEDLANGPREDIAVGELTQRNPGDAGLLGVGGLAGDGRDGGIDPAFEHELDLMDIAVVRGELVVFADVFANESEFADIDVDANFLEAFAPEGIVESLAVMLSAAGEAEPIAIGVFVADEQETVLTDDDGLGGIADIEHASIIQRTGARVKELSRVGLWVGDEVGYICGYD